MRYADRLGDFISDAYFAAEEGRGEADLAALARIDRSKLNATDRIAYDVFKWQTEDTLKNYQPEILALDRRPADQPFQRLPHLLPDLRLGRRAPRRSRRWRIMRII